MTKVSTPDIRWEDIVTFHTVASEASFTRAASQLRLSTPTVSDRIRRLERAVKTRLLHRSSAAVSLTSAGRVFHRWAVQVIDSQTSMLESLFADLAGQTPAYGSPTIRLGFDLGTSVSDEAADSYRLAAGAANIVTSQMPDRACWQALVDGFIDAAFRYVPAEAVLAPPTGIMVRSVCYTPVLVLGSEAILEQFPEGTPVPIDCLANLTWAVSAPGEPTHEAERALLSTHGITKFAYSDFNIDSLLSGVLVALTTPPSTSLPPGLSVRLTAPLQYTHHFMAWNPRVLRSIHADALFDAFLDRARRANSHAEARSEHADA